MLNWKYLRKLKTKKAYAVEMILKLVEMAKRTYKLNRLDQYLANNELVYSFLNWIAFIFRCSLESLFAVVVLVNEFSKCELVHIV